MAMEVGQLVRLAASGERAAWESLVERYEGLLWSVARSHRLDSASASDVVQTTWLRLLEHVDDLRNPDALGGWLATTARNECLRVLRHQARTIPTEDDRIPEDSVPSNLDAQLLERERDAALWRAFAGLSARCQTLLRMLAADPAPSYEDVGAALDMPVGSIGPTRGRCLAALRRALPGARITPVPPRSYNR
ncbi:MAG TPA: sigma-70 family RNA polymerase sigma factor [Solirubrobacteraceae bacterium]|nr:sigma-70 family RNA polymerase sigma factor [Solirubrobacteraceae bacterium]